MHNEEKAHQPAPGLSSLGEGTPTHSGPASARHARVVEKVTAPARQRRQLQWLGCVCRRTVAAERQTHSAIVGKHASRSRMAGGPIGIRWRSHHTTISERVPHDRRIRSDARPGCRAGNSTRHLSPPSGSRGGIRVEVAGKSPANGWPAGQTRMDDVGVWITPTGRSHADAMASLLDHARPPGAISTARCTGPIIRPLISPIAISGPGLGGLRCGLKGCGLPVRQCGFRPDRVPIVWPQILASHSTASGALNRHTALGRHLLFALGHLHHERLRHPDGRRQRLATAILLF